MNSLRISKFINANRLKTTRIIEFFYAIGTSIMSVARVDLQCILMLSYKYHCLVRSNPEIVIFSGMDVCRSDVDNTKSISTASVSENVCAHIYRIHSLSGLCGLPPVYCHCPHHCGNRIHCHCLPGLPPVHCPD